MTNVNYVGKSFNIFQEKTSHIKKITFLLHDKKKNIRTIYIIYLTCNLKVI